MKPVALVVAAGLWAALLAALLGSVGCSSPPTIRLHSLLSAQADSSAVRADAKTARLPVDLGAVGVPASVDQPQWLVRLPDDSLRLLEQEQWASPLRDELRAALWDRLSSRFGAVDARGLQGASAWRVQVDVQRFESIVGKEVWLESTWSISSPARGGATVACRSSIREAFGGSASAMAAAHQRAVVRLGDEVGTVLLALARGQGECGKPL